MLTLGCTSVSPDGSLTFFDLVSMVDRVVLVVDCLASHRANTISFLRLQSLLRFLPDLVPSGSCLL